MPERVIVMKKRLLLLTACLASLMANADNWQPLTGAERLHTFVSGATVDIQLLPGVTAVGTYHADGTAQISAWNEIFERTWKVKGDDQVCYTSKEEQTNCYTFEQNLDDALEFRVHNVESGEVFVFHAVDGKTRQLDRENVPGEAGGMGAPSASEIAAQLSNPNTTLGSMNTQIDYIAYDGDIPGSGDADALRLLFQPSLPYPLSETSNLFVRPAIPVIFDQDVPDPAGGFDSKGVELGDISFDASYAKTLPGGYVLLGGVAGTFPTATDDELGLDQWLLGPEAALAVVRPWGVVGMLVSHQWDVAGEDDYDTSITGGQYFYTLNLAEGWQINSSPTFSYNHEARGDDKWTLPLGVGVSRTLILAGRPWKFGLQYWHYVETPDTFGPDYQLRFSVSPVVKLPW
jgi:hypothetical protein